MKRTRYWGRFKIGRTWSDLWHLIPASNRDEAVGKFLKNTRYTPQQIQITTVEPKKWAGRH
jgi:hypothetical protein